MPPDDDDYCPTPPARWNSVSTVGELRRLLVAFDDDLPIRGGLRLAFNIDLTDGSYFTADTTRSADA